mmetsp:Transcript_11957/g.20188  ORF Transcript_11957/g.20188 Transcript_11957/m.20188 type:complete len:354 (-) Transcript_11957:407-1468(-)|eukprot:CAMPEP_0119322672 /NCGR_PEP_ID=MMETSP1333-20130426/58864_1 /TAXON_ID=418940 /ORGANISM="Scyphosphaera apsteinii, Strain RCC1455" /LENGTH=353 /DNA_ID=CAMNT_0007329957 /DNA_START=109 /DNA_END=1170 /DNA_ORIENTATION=-
MSDLTSRLALVIGTSFGMMSIGAGTARSGLLGTEGRKGVSALYAKVVFPVVVFRGVAAINLVGIDASVLLVMLAAKYTVAFAGVALGCVLLGRVHKKLALAHGAMWGMAVSHSFDVTLGVPIATVLYPANLPYVFLNQTMQLVLVNPVLLCLIELAKSSNTSTARLLATIIRGVCTNPLVVMTVLGLASAYYLPDGLPLLISTLGKQVADAGQFLGFASLGFAMAAIGSTTIDEACHCVLLCALKIGATPLLYQLYATAFRCNAGSEMLVFLGSLPASASVFALSLTSDFSPKVLGPLVPSSLLLTVALVLLPRAAVPIRMALAASAILAARFLLLRSRSPSVPAPKLANKTT